LATYIRSLKPRQPPAPPAALRGLVERGREIFFSNETDKHGRTSHLSSRDIHALAEFLRHLEPPE